MDGGIKGAPIEMKNSDNLCRVLLVDDDKLIRDILRALLSTLGASIVGEAENGEAAVQAFDDYSPDITFLDIQMPVKNGIETLKEILNKDQNAIVVMLSTISDPSVAELCFELGARNFITKGIPPRDLTLLLKKEIDLTVGEAR